MAATVGAKTFDSAASFWEAQERLRVTAVVSQALESVLAPSLLPASLSHAPAEQQQEALRYEAQHNKNENKTFSTDTEKEKEKSDGFVAMRGAGGISLVAGDSSSSSGDDDEGDHNDAATRVTLPPMMSMSFYTNYQRLHAHNSTHANYNDSYNSNHRVSNAAHSNTNTPKTSLGRSPPDVLLSHGFQSHEQLRHHDHLRLRQSSLQPAFQYRRFQPIHSPVVLPLSLAAAPPPPSLPFVLPPPSLPYPPTIYIPPATTADNSPSDNNNHNNWNYDTQGGSSGYTSPMRANSRSFKKQKIMYKCTWSGCSKEFQKPSLLKSHENIHNAIKPYECKHCDVSFARNHDLRRHERCVHMIGGKEAQCSGCFKLFTRLDSCRYHERTCLTAMKALQQQQEQQEQLLPSSGSGVAGN
ncbi:hypothetical protein HK100_010095 [Physocladia obscura]|uniref:C2H2-type domain-containing protein n=1 Tax=Physocladia obscura TaxID=109957 RepID=A0AAD5XEU5_9FUNG|nr:hypothetical protein HK100_010095 [Physocladia obscura]